MIFLEEMDLTTVIERIIGCKQDQFLIAHLGSLLDLANYVKLDVIIGAF